MVGNGTYTVPVVNGSAASSTHFWFPSLSIATGIRGPSFRVPLFAARALFFFKIKNATGQPRVTLSLQQRNIRAGCGLRQEERAPEIRPKTTLAGHVAQHVTLSGDGGLCPTPAGPGCSLLKVEV